MKDSPQLLFTNIIVAIFNGWVCGFNVAMLSTGNSTIPVLTWALIVVNGGAAIWIAKRTFDRLNITAARTSP